MAMDFCLLLKIWVNISVKNISKNLSGKYCQNIDHTKQSTTDALKASKRVIQKTADATGDLIGNKIYYQSNHQLHLPFFELLFLKL